MGVKHEDRQQRTSTAGRGLTQAAKQQQHARQRSAKQQAIVRGLPPDGVAEQVPGIACRVDQRVERPALGQRHHRPHAVVLGVERIRQRPAADVQVEGHECGHRRGQDEERAPPARHEPAGSVTGAAEEPRRRQDRRRHERLGPCPSRQSCKQAPETSICAGIVERAGIRNHRERCQRGVERHLHARQAGPDHAWRDGNGHAGEQPRPRTATQATRKLGGGQRRDGDQSDAKHFRRGNRPDSPAPAAARAPASTAARSSPSSTRRD